jgi:cysteine desulfurase
MKLGYFDYNATHPPFKEILLESIEKYSDSYFNPSGPTRFSLSKQGELEEARTYFATLTKKNKEQFVFSSTGTEANTLLIHSLKKDFLKYEKVYVSPFEHSSIYETLHEFKIPISLIKTDKTGIVDLEYLENQMKISPAPVVLIYAANETGVIQPMGKVKSILENYNMPIFSDLMQAFCKIEINYELLNGFTFSGHKIGAGLGASLSYIDEEFTGKNFGVLKGGNQENNHRAGTENTAAIESFQKSTLKQLENLEIKNKRLLSFRDTIESAFKNLEIQIIAEDSPRLPSTIFALLPIEEVDFFMLGLEERKILISNGSSCKSRSREASTSLLNMGYSKDEALRAVRISMGYFTNEAEVTHLIQSTTEVLNALR